mmetsp:Transcript_15982/g.36576  ORF Transcript_15982/g.36576 Transcript_15982/m.36576 type:complete len:306 (-) Transcript_15982:28-945(-)
MERADAPMPRRNWRYEDFWIPGALVFGFAVGVISTPVHGQSSFLEWLSAVLGWTYFCAWSVSFWPQAVENAVKKSVAGLSLDFQLFNILGFVCYFAFNAALYWSPHMQAEYREAHDGHNSAVRFNDVCFAGHAVVLTAVQIGQIFVYWDYPPPSRADKLLRRAVLSAVSITVVLALLLGTYILITSEKLMNWLTFLQILSEVKVVVSTFKYCPQVWKNYSRKSTVGWSIHNVLLDFIGGALSVAQLLLDAYIHADWTAISGDPAKLLLGNLTMFFDVIFVIQHYCLYAAPVVTRPAVSMSMQQAA